MQDQQATCVLTRLDPPLCDECHRTAGAMFLQGQWLCPNCGDEFLMDLKIEARDAR